MLLSSDGWYTNDELFAMTAVVGITVAVSRDLSPDEPIVVVAGLRDPIDKLTELLPIGTQTYCYSWPMTAFGVGPATPVVFCRLP